MYSVIDSVDYTAIMLYCLSQVVDAGKDVVDAVEEDDGGEITLPAQVTRVIRE